MACTGLLNFSGGSQGITLTYLNSGYIPGNSSTTFNVDTTDILPGNAGSNIYWDFSNLFVNHTPTTINYIDPKSTKYSISFLSATVAYSSGTDFINYFKINNSENTILGTGYNDFKTVFSNPQTLLTYPFKYGDELSDSFFCNTAGLADGLISGLTYVKADGWGTIKLPHNTYNNVLRISYNISEKDSSFEMDCDKKTQKYVWYDGIHKTPILEITYSQMLLSGDSVPYYFKYILVADFTNGLAEDFTIRTDFKLFPNPADQNTDISYDLNNESEVNLAIYNIYGELIRVVKSGKESSGYHIENIPLTGFQPGIYFLQLKRNDSIMTQKLIIEL